MSAFKVLEGRRGHLTMVYADGKHDRYLHSLYNPIEEAETLVNGWNIGNETHEISVIGLGLGYHLAACLERFPQLKRITVVECYKEVIDLFRQHNVQLSNGSWLDIVHADSSQRFADIVSQLDVASLFFHPPSIPLIPYGHAREFAQEMMVLQMSTLSQAESLFANWTGQLQKITSIGVWSKQTGAREAVQGILVAGGPSLDAALPYLKEAAGRSVIVSVAGVLNQLLHHGIQPDLVVLTDRTRKALEPLEALDSASDLPRLLVLPTTHPHVTDVYRGPISFVLQRGLPYTEQFALEGGYDLFETGGSVSTLALSILYDLGCNPILFVGQDLAYVDGRTHASGIHAELLDVQPKLDQVIQVSDVAGDPIGTNTTWNIYRHWIENFIRNHPARTYYNGSHGAHIAGTEPVRLTQTTGVLADVKK